MIKKNILNKQITWHNDFLPSLLKLYKKKYKFIKYIFSSGFLCSSSEK